MSAVRIVLSRPDYMAVLARMGDAWAGWRFETPLVVAMWGGGLR